MIVCKKLIFQSAIPSYYLAITGYLLRGFSSFKVYLEDRSEVGESVVCFGLRAVFWAAVLWKEICAGPWHHCLLCAETGDWNTDAVILFYIFDMWNCDNKVGKVLWISYGMDVIVPGKGYLVIEATIINPLQECVSFAYPVLFQIGFISHCCSYTWQYCLI